MLYDFFVLTGAFKAPGGMLQPPRGPAVSLQALWVGAGPWFLPV
jgi:hypothetical protein